MGKSLIFLKAIVFASGFFITGEASRAHDFQNSLKTNFLKSYFESRPDCRPIKNLLIFCGSSSQEEKMLMWLNEILRTSVGKETLQAIEDSSHWLLIAHRAGAESSAGRTVTEMSGGLIDGRGNEVVIEMNFDMPHSGSHLVANRFGDLIPFTAPQNLFHELVHARHKLRGTWRIRDSEGQAVEEENLYRIEESEFTKNPQKQRLQRSLELTHLDEQVWPEHQVAFAQ